MRAVIATALLGAVLAGSPGAQVESTRASDSLERPFAQNGRIRMDLTAGEYHIEGSTDARVRIEWSVRDSDQLSRVRALADIHGSDANITTDAPRNKGLKVTIKVPNRSDLFVRLTAGDIQIEDVRGNKDIELYAGDVRIDVGRAEDYHTVDASVWAGDLHAAPFNV